jgi:hypothetical protein
MLFISLIEHSFILLFRLSVTFLIIVIVASFVDLFYLNANSNLLSISCLSKKKKLVIFYYLFQNI